MCDKVMSQITLFHSGRGYYCDNIRILWKNSRSMDIICTLWIYPKFMDTMQILLTPLKLATLQATQVIMSVMFFPVLFWLLISFLVTLQDTQLVISVLSIKFYQYSESDWCRRLNPTSNHIYIKYHRFRHHHGKNFLIQKIKSENKRVDIFTKGLKGELFVSNNKLLYIW